MAPKTSKSGPDGNERLRDCIAKYLPHTFDANAVFNRMAGHFTTIMKKSGFHTLEKLRHKGKGDDGMDRRKPIGTCLLW